MNEKTAVSKLVEGKILALMAAGKIKGFKPHKIQVSTRLSSSYVVNLDVLAEALGESRTGLATELLQASILDASAGLGIPAFDSQEWFDQYGEKLREYGGEIEGFTDEEIAELEGHD